MANRQAVLDTLTMLGIDYTMDEHPAVYTVEEVDELHIFDKGCGCKNLFLRDEKGKTHFLAVLPEHKVTDLKLLAAQVGTRRLSFASQQRLEKHLAIRKGEVTPLAVINDASHEVVLAIDNDLVGQSMIGVHPNDNTATVWLDYESLMKYINHFGNRVIHVDL